MRILLSLLLMFTQSGYAFQFGTGMAPGMQCPYNYGPSGAAYQGNDEIRNLAGQLSTAERRLEQKEQRLRAMNAEINQAKAKIRRVIKSTSALSEIERHYKYKANPEDYSRACGRRERTASVGGQSANVVHRPSRSGAAAGDEDPGRYAVPSDFCQNGVNDWQHVVAEDGMVLDTICEYEIPLSRNRPDESRSSECREGLDEYYARMGKKEALEQEVRALKEKVNAYNENKERIQDEIAEGTYCPYCNSQRRGQNQMGTGNFAMMGVALLGALFNRQQQRPPPQPMLVRVPRMQPPGVLPMRPGGPPQVMPFPGPAAYPGRPYAAAPMRGFPMVHPGSGPGRGIYGAAPGGIGPGAFGCQGTSPYSFGNPLAPQFMPFQNGGASPFANPHMNGNLFGQGQFPGQHPLLNPGFGPGIMPFLGNGVNGYNQYDPFADPFGNNPYSQFGQNAPGVLPFQGGNPFLQNQYNPYAPYGNPYYNAGAPGVLPYNSPYGSLYGNQFGGGQYGLGAPGVLPFQMGGSQYPMGHPLVNANYMNMPYNSPYGGMYAPTPVQSYGYQMHLLQRGINQIGNGQYGAPAVLPYVPPPVYNTPGSSLNPVGPPRTPPPQAPPPGGAPPTRPVQIR